MRRRALLGVAAAATVGHAGCLDRGGDDETPTGTDGHEDDEGDSPTETDDPDDGDAGDGAGTETDAGDGAGTEADDGDGQGTETESTESTPGETRLADREMEIKSVECGSGEDHWEVDVDDGVVTVDGAIGGNHGCYSARIASAEYDGDEDVLRTTIESYDDSRDGETGCMQCIVDIYYRATYTFEGGEPGEVDVEHDGYTA